MVYSSLMTSTTELESAARNLKAVAELRRDQDRMSSVFDGNRWIPGVITDHAGRFEVRTGRSGRPFAVDIDGRAFPLLCGEIVPWASEDGPSDRRCALRVEHADHLGCPGHDEMVRSYHHQNSQIDWDWSSDLNERF